MPRELPVTCLSVEPRFDPLLLALGGSQKVSNAGPKTYKSPNGSRAPTGAARGTAASGYQPASRRPLSEVNSLGKNSATFFFLHEHITILYILLSHLFYMISLFFCNVLSNKPATICFHFPCRWPG